MVSNILKHWKTVRMHRKWVRHYCFLAGIPWRGITHDLSKYSPIEFFESARHYDGQRSPIEVAKETQGYSRAWLHHRGRNSHHWTYWTDNYSEGLTTYLMPEKDFVEMVCDFLAAAKAYNPHSVFLFDKELDWWNKEKVAGCNAMHPKNKARLDIILNAFAEAENPQIYNLEPAMIKSPEQMIKEGFIQKVYREIK